MKLTVQRGTKQEYLNPETGRRYFSVTQVRQTVHDGTLHVPPDVLEVARQRGQILHQRFWRMLASRVGLVDPPAIIPGLEGFCQAMDTWAVANKVEPIDVEHQIVNDKLGYAGTLDALIYHGLHSQRVLADLKTGQRSVTDVMQLLAYNAALKQPCRRCLDLYVFANGSYHENWVTVKDRLEHWPPFLNALNLLRWKLTHV